MKHLLLVAAATATPLVAQSEVLAKYDFIGESLADSAGNPNTVTSSVSVNRDIMFWSGNGYSNICFGSAWTAPGGHLEFSVSPANPGEALNLTELDINYGGHGAGGDVDRMEVYADEDAGPGGDNFQTRIFGTNNLDRDIDVDLSSVGFLQGIGGTVTFRIEFFGTDGSGSSNHEVDHFRLDGERVSHPPSSGSNPCIGEQFFFGPEWSGSHYSVNGQQREWYFPDWTPHYDVACIPNGDDHTHSIPAIFSKNDCSIGCRRMEFKMKGRNDDGDSIGFTLGFCDGDETNPDADYLAVIWNGSSTQTAQVAGCAPAGTRPDGLHLVRVFGVPDPQEFWSQTNLDLPCSDLDSGVELLTEAIHLGDTGWPANVEQCITVELLPNNLKVFVGNSLEIDRDGDYMNILSGCFGFYNQSQFADYYQLEVTPLNAVVADSNLYGDGLEGCFGVPVIDTVARPVLNTSVGIELSNPSDMPVACCIFVGSAPADVFVPFLGGSILVDLNTAADINVVIPPGGIVLPCQIPDDSCAAGNAAYLQLVCLDDCAPGMIALSRGLRMLLGDL